MARVTTNFAEVAAGIEAIAHALDFDRSPKGRRPLGEELADVVVEQTRSRTIDRQQDADGNPLAKLAASTLKSKARRSQPATIGVASGEMLDDLRGPVEIAAQALTVNFGGSEATDEELDWFVSGDESRNRPPRDIIGVDPQMDAAIDALLDETLDAALGGLGGP